MDIIIQLFGEGKDLSVLQMSDRTVVVFFIAYALIRISGRRSFGMGSPFDNIIILLLGAVLSRAIVGASPFWPTVASCAVLVLLHRLLAWLAVRNKRIDRAIKAERMILYKNGKIVEENMTRCMISKEDLQEAVQLNGNTESLADVESIYMERNGEISIIKAKKD